LNEFQNHDDDDDDGDDDYIRIIFHLLEIMRL